MNYGDYIVFQMDQPIIFYHKVPLWVVKKLYVGQVVFRVPSGSQGYYMYSHFHLALLLRPGTSCTKLEYVYTLFHADIQMYHTWNESGQDRSTAQFHSSFLAGVRTFLQLLSLRWPWCGHQRHTYKQLTHIHVCNYMGGYENANLWKKYPVHSCSRAAAREGDTARMGVLATGTFQQDVADR